MLSQRLPPPPYQEPWKLFFVYLYRLHDLDFVDERDHGASVCVCIPVLQLLRRGIIHRGVISLGRAPFTFRPPPTHHQPINRKADVTDGGSCATFRSISIFIP